METGPHPRPQRNTGSRACHLWRESQDSTVQYASVQLSTTCSSQPERRPCIIFQLCEGNMNSPSIGKSDTAGSARKWEHNVTVIIKLSSIIVKYRTVRYLWLFPLWQLSSLQIFLQQKIVNKALTYFVDSESIWLQIWFKIPFFAGSCISLRTLSSVNRNKRAIKH